MKKHQKKKSASFRIYQMEIHLEFFLILNSIRLNQIRLSFPMYGIHISLGLHLLSLLLHSTSSRVTQPSIQKSSNGYAFVHFFSSLLLFIHIYYWIFIFIAYSTLLYLWKCVRVYVCVYFMTNVYTMFGYVYNASFASIISGNAVIRPSQCCWHWLDGNVQCII